MTVQTQAADHRPVLWPSRPLKQCRGQGRAWEEGAWRTEDPAPCTQWVRLVPSPGGSLPPPGLCSGAPRAPPWGLGPRTQLPIQPKPRLGCPPRDTVHGFDTCPSLTCPGDCSCPVTTRGLWHRLSGRPSACGQVWTRASGRGVCVPSASLESPLPLPVEMLQTSRNKKIIGLLSRAQARRLFPPPCACPRRDYFSGVSSWKPNAESRRLQPQHLDV